jgi:hypothetical protein
VEAPGHASENPGEEPKGVRVEDCEAGACTPGMRAGIRERLNYGGGRV